MDEPAVILCAVDDDAQAPALVAAARTLGAALRREVRFVHVLRHWAPAVPIGGEGGARTLPLAASLLFTWEDEELLAARAAGVDALWRRLGVQAHEGIVGFDDPAMALLTALRRFRADLVLVGSRGRGPVRGALLGSVWRVLTRDAGCPVAVIPPNANSNFVGESVLCALQDGWDVGRPPDIAVRLAQAFAVRLVLARVTPTMSLSRRPAGSHAGGTERAAPFAPVGCEHAQPAVAIDLAVRRGRVVDQVLALASDLHAGALVATAHRSGPFRGVLVGSSADRLVVRSPCPVVVARPDAASGGARASDRRDI